MDITHFGLFQSNCMHGSEALQVTSRIQQGKLKGVAIDCPGGVVGPFMDHAVAMSEQRFPALAYRIGSLAVDYFLCAEVRYAVPSSSFFLHHPSVTIGSSHLMKLGELQANLLQQHALLEKDPGNEGLFIRRALLTREIELLAETQHFGVRWMARRTGLPANIIDQMMHDEATLTASEALRLGFVHHIIEP